MPEDIIELALDIGNSKIKFILGKLSNAGQKMEILNYVEVPSEGIKKSKIENSSLLIASISQGLQKIRSKCDCQLNKVNLCFSHNEILSKRGSGHITFERRKITEKEVKALIKSVEKEVVKSDEFVLESVLYNCKINNAGVLKSPIGVESKQLMGDVYFVTIKKDILTPLLHVVASTGLEVSDIYLSVVGASASTLSEINKQKGAVLIDIGKEITDIAIYKNEKLIYAKSIPIASSYFSSDISYFYKITKIESEAIYKKIEKKDYKDGVIIVNQKEYDVKKIQEIMEARSNDILKYVLKILEESGFAKYLNQGILVFTGGSIAKDIIVESERYKSNYALKNILPVKIRGLETPTSDMASVLGTLLLKLEKEDKILKNKIVNISDREIEKCFRDGSIVKVNLTQKDQNDVDDKKENISNYPRHLKEKKIDYHNLEYTNVEVDSETEKKLMKDYAKYSFSGDLGAVKITRPPIEEINENSVVDEKTYEKKIEEEITTETYEKENCEEVNSEIEKNENVTENEKYLEDESFENDNSDVQNFEDEKYDENEVTNQYQDYSFSEDEGAVKIVKPATENKPETKEIKKLEPNNYAVTAKTADDMMTYKQEDFEEEEPVKEKKSIAKKIGKWFSEFI